MRTIIPRRGRCEKAARHSQKHDQRQSVCSEEGLGKGSKCGTDFSQKSSLVQHWRVRTQAWPGECCDCGTSLSQKSGLIQHHGIHTEERPCGCSDRKSFTAGLYLTTRKFTLEKSHSSVVIAKSFRHRSKLIDHYRGHTDERPYECSKWRKSFRCKDHLLKHKRFHRGEKPYKCSECGKTFRRNYNLRQHRNVHTGEKRMSAVTLGSPSSRTRASLNTRGATPEKSHTSAASGETLWTTLESYPTPAGSLREKPF